MNSPVDAGVFIIVVTFIQSIAWIVILY